MLNIFFFFFSSRRRHTRWNCDWSSDVCSSDLRMLAVIESRLGYPDRAVIAIQEALKLDPDDPATLNIQGAILMGMNRLPAALAAFDRASSRSPEFLPALLNRGNALLYLNR